MSQKQLRQDMIMLVSAVFMVLILGALLFSALEGWHLIDAFYFVTMTATTVGYGDLTPTTLTSKVITILYALSIVPFVLYAFSAVAKSQISKVYSKVHHLERKQKEQEEEIGKAERKIRRQKTLIKQHEQELDKQEKKIKQQVKINKAQESEISEHDKELEVVEKVMEKALTK